jgi:hypothetical protein
MSCWTWPLWKSIDCQDEFLARGRAVGKVVLIQGLTQAKQRQTAVAMAWGWKSLHPCLSQPLTSFGHYWCFLSMNLCLNAQVVALTSAAGSSERRQRQIKLAGKRFTLMQTRLLWKVHQLVQRLSRASQSYCSREQSVNKSAPFLWSLAHKQIANRTTLTENLDWCAAISDWLFVKKQVPVRN